MIPLQCPNDLQLVLVQSRDLHLDVHVLKTRTITAKNVAITFRIIGESHWILVEQGGAVFHEMLACVPSPHPSPAFVHRFDASDRCAFTTEGYSVDVRLATLTAEIAMRGQAHQGIEVLFPHPYNGLSLPFTRVWWAIDDDSIQWWTTHVYPQEEETVAVVSASRYDIRRGMTLDQQRPATLGSPYLQKVEG